MTDNELEHLVVSAVANELEHVLAEADRILSHQSQKIAEALVLGHQVRIARRSELLIDGLTEFYNDLRLRAEAARKLANDAGGQSH